MTSAQTDEILPIDTTPSARGQAAARAYLFHLGQKRKARRETVGVAVEMSLGIVMIVGLFLAAWSIF